MADLNVYLYYNWDTTNPIDTRVTNDQGRYWFDLWDPSEYVVAVEAPDGMVPVEKDEDLFFGTGSKINLDTLNTMPFIMHGTDGISNFNCDYFQNMNAGFKPE